MDSTVPILKRKKSLSNYNVFAFLNERNVYEKMLEFVRVTVLPEKISMASVEFAHIAWFVIL